MMANDIHKDDDFDGYLNSLVDKEKQKHELAIEYYKEWAYHFELLKKNFEGAMELFYKISQALPGWRCEGPSLEEQVQRDGRILNAKSKEAARTDQPPSPVGLCDNSYFFEARLIHEYVDDEYGNDYIDKIVIKTNHWGIGNPSEIFNLPCGYNLPPIETVIKNKGLTLGVAKGLFGDIDTNISIEVGYGEEVGMTEEAEHEARVPIGYLYEHNLPDLCKGIFKFITQDGEEFEMDNIEHLFPTGEFPIRNPEDNNMPPAVPDSGWKNE